MADDKPVKREWHKVEFLTPGMIAREPEPIHEERVTFTQGPQGTVPQRNVEKVLTAWKHREYHPQKSLGHGYYVVEDGVVVAHKDEQGNDLDMERVHECRIVAVLKNDPFAQA